MVPSPQGSSSKIKNVKANNNYFKISQIENAIGPKYFKNDNINCFERF